MQFPLLIISTKPSTLAVPSNTRGLPLLGYWIRISRKVWRYALSLLSVRRGLTMGSSPLQRLPPNAYNSEAPQKKGRP